MPTAAPIAIPAAMLPGGPLNQYDWGSIHHDEAQGYQQSAAMRGTGGALTFWQRRQIAGPSTIAQGQPAWLQSRPYSRGAGAYSPKFGVINYNPIGAGVYSPYKLPVIAGPGARYQLGAIWFDVQSVPTTMRMSPTMSMASVDALLSTSYVAAMYATTG
jgi:hypothetical protein